jgi:N,N'-diacetyllegionaminate synthase
MPVVIIAEIGVNHNGDIRLAKKMVDKAKECGADIVKFQTSNPEALVTKYAEKAKYQIENTGEKNSQLEMIKKITLSYSEFIEIEKYCREQEVVFLSTPFDCQSIDFLNQFPMPFWKIPSGEITNYPYLVKIAKTGKKIVMSTGMSTLDEIRAAFDILKTNGAGKIILLHCNTQYPTRLEDVNLRAMCTLKNEFGVEVGYSDHTMGIEVPVAAVALGASVIEKHFTMDRTMEGPDHKASLEPKEFAAMVKAVRNTEKLLGSEKKQVTDSERENMAIARKSIIADKDISKGEVFTEENLTTKRPGNGLSPMLWEQIIGRRASRNFRKDEMIEL